MLQTNNENIKLKIEKNGNSVDNKVVLENKSDTSVFMQDIKVYGFAIDEIGFSENAFVYVDGFQMLNQTYLKVSEFSDNTPSGDKDHYKLPYNEGFFTGYNYMYFEEKDRCLLIGATSCKRFNTQLRINCDKVEMVQLLENKEIPANSETDLESFCVIEAKDRNECLSIFADCISVHHKKLPFREIPDGWCSWYCYGAFVTESAINKNMKSAKKDFPELKYIQIDDGYQPHMGDWLLQTKKFRHKMKNICLNIRKEGFEPAIWVAPFIASEKSKLFKKHPDWFVKNNNNEPLCAADCTFRGWRDAPWYFLDLTNPQARSYIKEVFRIMKYEWKVDYFKLDANTWGVLPFGKRYDESLTSVEAYRMGMNAIWEAVGNDYENTYLLGCNAALWPSLGVVNGMRITMDVSRKIDAIKSLSRQCFYRNWMHNKLWINDPDCLVQVGVKNGLISSLNNHIPKRRNDNESMYRYAACFIRASGGMLLSGDRLYSLSEYDKKIMKKLLKSERKSAKFNSDFSIGIIDCKDYTDYLLFNDTKKNRKLSLEIDSEVINMFTDEKKTVEKQLTVNLLPDDAVWYRAKK